MHELGHPLDLDHGGTDGKGNTDDTNFKPNYHSLMNYTWALPVPWMFEDKSTIGGPNVLVDHNNGGDTIDIAWVLNYSDVEFNTLNEASLDEAEGIGGHAEHWVIVGPQPPVSVS